MHENMARIGVELQIEGDLSVSGMIQSGKGFMAPEAFCTTSLSLRFGLLRSPE
jgi:hypothetical protein